jgi:hypothetical protein
VQVLPVCSPTPEKEIGSFAVLCFSYISVYMLISWPEYTALVWPVQAVFFRS